VVRPPPAFGVGTGASLLRPGGVAWGRAGAGRPGTSPGRGGGRRCPARQEGGAGGRYLRTGPPPRPRSTFRGAIGANERASAQARVSDSGTRGGAEGTAPTGGSRPGRARAPGSGSVLCPGRARLRGPGGRRERAVGVLPARVGTTIALGCPG
jgi:hypothetical protein